MARPKTYQDSLIQEKPLHLVLEKQEANDFSQGELNDTKGCRLVDSDSGSKVGRRPVSTPNTDQGSMVQLENGFFLQPENSRKKQAFQPPASRYTGAQVAVKQDPALLFQGADVDPAGLQIHSTIFDMGFGVEPHQLSSSWKCDNSGSLLNAYARRGALMSIKSGCT